MNKTTLEAKVRKVTGRKVKTLRKEGWLPANIYGKKIKSQVVQVKALDFGKAYQAAGETGLISLMGRAVLVSGVQTDPLTDAPIHVDFRQVDLKEKVTAGVPVGLVGESPAEKGGIGTVVQYIDEIEVEALPTDLPEKFEIDASGLSEVDQAVFVSDLKYDKAKVEVKNDPEEIIVKVEPPQKEEVVAPPPAEGPAATEAEAGKEAPKEGEEVPVEGEAQAPSEEPQQEKSS